jgi:hypothetical protein
MSAAFIAIALSGVSVLTASVVLLLAIVALLSVVARLRAKPLHDQAIVFPHRTILWEVQRHVAKLGQHASQIHRTVRPQVSHHRQHLLNGQVCCDVAHQLLCFSRRGSDDLAGSSRMIKH